MWKSLAGVQVKLGLGMALATVIQTRGGTLDNVAIESARFEAARLGYSYTCHADAKVAGLVTDVYSSWNFPDLFWNRRENL